jgi:hypothetical protein
MDNLAHGGIAEPVAMFVNPPHPLVFSDARSFVISLFNYVTRPRPSLFCPLKKRPVQKLKHNITNEKKLATSSILIAISALCLLYRVTFKKDWPFEEIIPAAVIRQDE